MYIYQTHIIQRPERDVKDKAIQAKDAKTVKRKSSGAGSAKESSAGSAEEGETTMRKRTDSQQALNELESKIERNQKKREARERGEEVSDDEPEVDDVSQALETLAIDAGAGKAF
jgi:hypothetical protein